jgi:3-oxoacyl-(acyl-carrier-protein) synthase
MGMIRDGHVDAMVAGGTEATITPLCFAGFCAMKAMNTNYNENPQAGSRPFDKDRGGFIMGEGAGVVVLESLASAKKRGAPQIYCELVGYGATCGTLSAWHERLAGHSSSPSALTQLMCFVSNSIRSLLSPSIQIPIGLHRRRSSHHHPRA